MSITLADVMKRPSMRGAEVLGGNKGLFRIVTSISVLEYADPNPLQEQLFESNEFFGSEISFGVTGKTVLLCDDVIYTGRTVRAAISEIMSMGRPAKIQFLALVDRGHRELPFKADFTGKSVPTSRREGIAVRFAETDGEDAVYIYEK